MNRFKYITALAVGMALVLSTTKASAQDWFQFEAGLGASHITDMGDGIWVQQGVPGNREHTNTPAVMAGFTGKLYEHGPFDVRYHADYVYIGTYAASVDGVPDNEYNAQTHHMVGYKGERMSPFNGQGHTQGVPLTLDVGYTWRGYRLAAEAGGWAYWQTWHESLYALDNEWHDLSHQTRMQFGYVVGARLERGPFSLSYRYYQIKQDWGKNGSPGLATGAHVVMATYRF